MNLSKPRIRRIIQLAVCTMTLGSAAAWAQAPGPGIEQGAPGTQLPGARARQQQGQPQQSGGDLLQNAYFTGQITLEDGTSPQEPVSVEMVCNGQSRQVAYSNLKGHFGFRLGDRSGEVTGDASLSGVPGGPQGGPGATLANDGFDSANMDRGFGGLSGRTAHRPGMVDLSGCDVVAVLGGYSSSRIYLGRRSATGESNLGTIVLRRLQKMDGASVSATNLAAPKKAQKFFDKAVDEMRKGNLDPRKAIGPLEKAVAEYPAYASAWSLLGELRMNSGDAAGGRKAFEKSIEADESYLKPYMPLIKLNLSQNNWKDAARLSEALIRLNPYLTEARFTHAFSSFNLKDMKAAEQSLVAIQTGADASKYPQTHRMLAFIYLQSRNFPKAATEMRAFVATSPTDPQAIAIGKKLEEWEAMGVIPKQQAASLP